MFSPKALLQYRWFFISPAASLLSILLSPCSLFFGDVLNQNTLILQFNSYFYFIKIALIHFFWPWPVLLDTSYFFCARSFNPKSLLLYECPITHFSSPGSQSTVVYL